MAAVPVGGSSSSLPPPLSNDSSSSPPSASTAVGATSSSSSSSSVFDLLCEELFVEILHWLSPKEIHRCMCVSKQWLVLISTNRRLLGLANEKRRLVVIIKPKGSEASQLYMIKPWPWKSSIQVFPVLVPRMEKRVNTVVKLGYKKCLVPKSSEKSLAGLTIEGTVIVGCRNLKEMINTVFRAG